MTLKEQTLEIERICKLVNELITTECKKNNINVSNIKRILK